MRKRFATWTLAGLCALAAAPACAQTADKHPLFDRMDANKDGFLTREEIRARFPRFTDEMFAQADTGKDGKLTVAEWQAFARQARAKRGG